MKLSNSSTVPVYTVSGSSTSRGLPEWLSEKKKRRLKKDPEYASKIELLQDFEFEEASQCVRISEDGQWVMSTGTYKPQIHTHYLPNLSLSWARHTNTLNKTFLMLSTDYSKTAHLQEDRSIEFHTPQGCHYSLRIPRYGRDLIYSKASAELLIPAVGVNADRSGEVFRINLEQGRFMREYEVDVGGDDLTSVGAGALQGGIKAGGVNTAAIADQSHNLLAFGTSIGTVEYWDPRSRSRVAVLGIPYQQELAGVRPEVTALDFHRSGITMAAGTSSGVIHLYDLRSPLPLLRKDHGYGYPVHTLRFLTPSSRTRIQIDEPKIMSADKRIIKIWDEKSGTPWTSVEPAVDINCVTWCQDSGMILTANEGRQQHTFFIPRLGPAPKWCTFLDSVVEEMADDPNDPNAYSSHQAGEIYENYKFLTMAQLQAINLDHLVGRTNLLRPYMHGYFVAQKLYEEARLIANPSSWEEDRAKRVKEKIEKERESRIRGKRQVTAKVNRELAEKILEREEKRDRRRAQHVLATEGNEGPENKTTTGKDEKVDSSLLSDSRFARLFQDADFAVDEASREFQSLNPSTKPRMSSNQDREKRLTAAEKEMIDEVPGSSSEDEGSSDHARSAAEREDHISWPSYKRRPSAKKQKPPRVQMHVTSAVNKRGRDSSFGFRASNLKPRERMSAGAGVGAVGEKVLSFESQSGKKKQNTQSNRSGLDQRRPNRDRRSASGNTFRRTR